MIQYTAKTQWAGTEMWIEIPNTAKAFMEKMWEKSRRLHNSYMTVRFELPRVPRTTGPHSQNNFIHGACTDIAQQLSDDDRTYTKDQVYDAMKRLAVKEGYPTYYDPIDDSVQPKHLSEATFEEADLVNKEAIRFADEHGFWLTRLDENKIPYHSIGGRSRAEMEAMR